jgi:hypothetical protein
MWAGPAYVVLPLAAILATMWLFQRPVILSVIRIPSGSGSLQVILTRPWTSARWGWIEIGASASILSCDEAVRLAAPNFDVVPAGKGRCAWSLRPQTLGATSIRINIKPAVFRPDYVSPSKSPVGGLFRVDPAGLTVFGDVRTRRGVPRPAELKAIAVGILAAIVWTLIVDSAIIGPRLADTSKSTES